MMLLFYKVTKFTRYSVFFFIELDINSISFSIY